MAVTHSYSAPETGETVVNVTFTSIDPALTHERAVNAVFDADGLYDSDATEQRVQEVANGVANKIQVGVIVPAVEEESEESGE